MFRADIKSERDEDICILIKVDNHSYNYICECGEAKSLTVKECQNANAIFLSHTHIDHFVNFDTILRHQIGVGRKIVICGPEGIIGQVQSRLKSYCWNLIDENAIIYEVREIHKGGKIKSAILKPPHWNQADEMAFSSGRVFEEKDFYVEYEILDHKTDSIAYLFKGHDKVKINLPDGYKGGKWIAELKQAFENNDRERLIKIGEEKHKAKDLFHMISIQKGKRLGVIMDHLACPENHEKIKKKFTGCDDVIIESFYKDEDKELAEKNYHSYASMSGHIMKQCQVSKVVPVHFSRKYSVQEIDELIEEFNEAFI
ncbi:peptidase [Aureibacter tunicatorum]|uniref:Ribonuclease Z n=1 Tax=Aureibacter tunicatorum TaxID=866807 RepID=A0AAE3XR35_9BACT|nr:peptidase [Aureibacter tunicatorum]MDR6240503.1 ribonuclease Z [Aureibacter tunicatorum]BDD06634.1 ribonuclease Z [Aureibacter tunicatorum]